MVRAQNRRDRQVAAEAAAWLARIQDDTQRDAYAEALQSWLAEDSTHRAAFSKATCAWDLIAGAHHGVSLAKQDSAPSAWAERLRRSLRQPAAALIAVCLMVACLGTGFLFFRQFRPLHYETAPGEQISIVLEDGSRVSLNTRSAVDVDYTRGLRRVTLLTGEAMFEVSKDPKRPFIVRNGNREVKALGTTFVVRKDPDRLSVTLIEGHVAVSTVTPGSNVGIATLNPGDRLTLQSGTPIRRDRPQTESVTAWRKGDVVFDDVALKDAAAEINRYSTHNEITVAPEVGAMRISGVFTTRDEGEFAVAAATTLGLTIRLEGNRILLIPAVTPHELRQP